jgi:TnpA family transposase
MRAFQSTYVGRHNFPKFLPDYLLRRWFTLNAGDRHSIRKTFRSRYWIGAALQLGFVGMTGTTLKSLEYVPTSVLRHLGRQFARPVPDVATLRTLYRRRKTRFEHQRWAVEQWGLREFDAGIEQRLTEYIRERTHATLSRGRLEQAAREWLYRTLVAIPRRRVITDLVRGVIQSVAQQDHRDLRRFMTEYSIQGFLRDLLSHRPGGTMTYLEWLRRPPRRRSLKTLRELYDKYQWLEERIGRGLPIPIPKERQQVYTRRLRRRRAAYVIRLPVFRQELEAICFAAVSLGTLADDMLRLVEIRITAIWTWGHRIVAEKLNPARVRRKSEILAALRRLVADQRVSDEAFRAQASSLLLPDQSDAPRSRAADVREVLSRNARRIRPILQLLVKLNLLGDGVGGDGLSWLDGFYHDGVDTFFVDKAPAWARRWKVLIEESDTQGSLRAYEAAAAWAVRQGLRNGSLYSKYGFEYSDPARQLMPPDIWEERRSSYQHEKDLPTAGHLYIERAQAALRASLAGLQEAVAAGEVWIGRKDLYFRRDEAEVRPEGVELAQSELYRKVGRIQLPTLLLELDAQVHFSWKLLGREPKSAEELLGVYGALLAAGTDLESRGVATMIRGVHESRIRHYMRLFESEPALREANDALLHFARSHDIVRHWGTGFEASSDLMSLDASKHLYDARVDPKRRVHGMGVYQTVLDQWGIPYDQPLPLMRRQVGAAIEGVVRQRVTSIRSLAVDTHGHTHFGSGQAKLLGFDLYTRWHDMRGQWLHVPKDWPEVPGLDPVLKRDIDLEFIQSELDELLRMAASINDGYGSATFLLERYGSAARQSKLHRAGTQFGQLWDAVYLCDYAAQPPFRRSVNRVLVRGESVHQLERVIHAGPIRFDRGRRRDEKIMISGALTLLTNAVIAYNTWKLNQVLERRRLAGQSVPSDAILAHIAPIAFRHINFQGIYRFPLERYLDRLLPSAPTELIAVGT